MSEAQLYWAFYPFKGLNITDLTPDLDNPLFGDATLVSINHEPILNQMYQHDGDKAKDHFSFFWNASFERGYESYVAVRRTGILIDDKFNPKFHDGEYILRSNLAKSLMSRAYQIGALITLATLVKYGRASGLFEQYHDTKVERIIVSFGEAGGSFTSSGLVEELFSIVEEENVIHISSEGLKDLLSEPPINHLARILMPQQNPLSHSFRGVIPQAAIRLANAIHNVSPTSQLLEAVTSLEILLAERNNKYDSVQKRIESLLGEEYSQYFDIKIIPINAVDPLSEKYYQRLEIKKILDHRHEYVHEGKDVEDWFLPIQAVTVAVACLLRYAELAFSFESKQDLLNYLDFLNDISTFAKNSRDNDEKERLKAFYQASLKHRQQGFSFAFYESYAEIKMEEAMAEEIAARSKENK